MPAEGRVPPDVEKGGVPAPLFVLAATLPVALHAETMPPPFITGRHPRLHFLGPGGPDDVRSTAELRQRLLDSDSPFARRIVAEVVRLADEDVAADPIIATQEGETNVRWSCGRVFDRIKRLGIAHLLTGDPKYFQAAWRQVYAMCDDWCEWVAEG